MIHPTILPYDQHNQQLLHNVHPPEWVNPVPADRYNLVVIGAGTAGLVTAFGAAGLGAKVALIERQLLGGDCLNVGCVPSKSLIRPARTAGELRLAEQLGWHGVEAAHCDFAAVMERLRRIRAQISPHDSAWRCRELGVDLFLGEGRFIDMNVIEVDGKRLRFNKAVIATGARPMLPEIVGLSESGYLTNETVFSLTVLPKRLLFIGGGPISCELAQAMARLGSKVFVLQAQRQFLPREDQEGAKIIEASLRRDGVDMRLGCEVLRVTRHGSSKQVHFSVEGRQESIEVDEIFVAVGRTPNVQGLNLEGAGVDYSSSRGVEVNDYLQTANPTIYAAGDVCSTHKFTHAADAAARLVLANALFFGSRKHSVLTIPWCTYTDPEIAHVGMHEADAESRGIQLRTFTTPMANVDRAVIDAAVDGFVKIHIAAASDEILGATIVGSHAGEMIGEIVLAMVNQVGLGKIANVIHPYPTQAEAIRKTADAYNRTRLTPLFKRLFNLWFEFQRS